MQCNQKTVNKCSKRFHKSKDLILFLHIQPKQAGYCREEGVNNGTWKGCTSSAYSIFVSCIFVAGLSG